MGKDKGHQALLIYFSARFYFIAQSRKIYWIVIIYWEVCSKINSINIHDSLRIVFLCRLFIISFRTLILGRFLPDLPSNRCTKSFCFVFFWFSSKLPRESEYSEHSHQAEWEQKWTRSERVFKIGCE